MCHFAMGLTHCYKATVFLHLLKIEAYKQRGEKKLYLSPIQLSHVFGPIGHVVLQGVPKMSDAKPVFLISQPAIVPVSSQRREVWSNM